MKNLFASGNTARVIATADILAGELVIFGNGHGVAQDDAKTDEEVILHLVGVFELAKNTSEAFASLEFLYWSTGSSELKTTAGGNKIVGHAYEVEQSAASTGKVRLIQRTAV